MLLLATGNKRSCMKTNATPTLAVSLAISLAIALVNGSAALRAAENIRFDDAELEQSVAMTSILESSVSLADGREIGEIADVLLADAQHIEHFLLDVDVSEEYNRGTTTFRDDIADYEEAPLYEGESTEDSLQLEYVLLPAGQLQYEETKQNVAFNLGAEGLSGLPRGDGPVTNSPEPYASQVIGMEVHLADTESFGSVEDVMLAPNGEKIVAYIVDSWDGLEKQRHALPAARAKFMRAEKENAIREQFGKVAVRFPYSAEQVNGLESFDLDAYRENELF